MIKSALINCILLGLLFGAPFFAIAQNEGIRFENAPSWNAVLAEAKAENKMIFMDCYASWCGPCKWMAKNIFPQREVGQYFNSHFICIEVQLDQTPNDSECIKNWYDDAKAIHQEYKIQDFPSFLFFSANGKLVHRFIGLTRDPSSFILKASDALDSSKQYYTGMNQLMQHDKDTAFLWKAYLAAAAIDDKIQAAKIAEHYLNLQPNLLTSRNISLIAKTGLLKSTDSKWFRFFLDNVQEIDRQMKQSDSINDYVSGALVPIILEEELKPLILDDKPLYWRVELRILHQKYYQLGQSMDALVEERFEVQIYHAIAKLVKNATNGPEWDIIAHKMKLKYPDYNFDKIMLDSKARYYYNTGKWEACGEIAYSLFRKCGDQMDDLDINQIAWFYVFQHCENRRIISLALKQMKIVVEIKGDSNQDYMDTYANLLYKVGQTVKALNIERKIVEIANETKVNLNEVDTWQENIVKMQEGKPTWSVNKAAS